MNLPFTTTKKVQLAEFPTIRSVTMYVTLFAPIPISLGSFVSTFLPSIISTTSNESMAFPDSLTSSELSLNEKFQVTVETFFPLSLFALIEIGHIGRGGSVSDKKIYIYYIDTDEIPVKKILYPVKIRILSFTCEDITVVMATSVSVNEIYKRFMPYCYNIQNTYKRYLFSLFFDQNSNVRKIYILLD